MNTKSLFASIVLMLGLSAAPVMATPLNLNLAETPDIVSSFLSVNYDSIAQVLTVDGFATQLDLDGIAPGDMITDVVGGTNPGLFNLTATVDNAGVFQSGSFSIFGSVLGAAPTTLISGILTAMGTDVSTLEFLFGVTGGSYEATFGGIGAIGGIIISQLDDNLTADWTADFASSSFSVQADTAAMPAPEPGILFLQGLGLLMLIGLRRRGTK
ncbi:MAG: hypothetical protein HKN85_08655 [Gammaproteobacteria bacterium]|nr:hypothetical protein [Gammaproteobacteria bacterium]